MSDRQLYVDNIDPEIIPSLQIDRIRPDAVPEKVINAVRLALADGEKFIGSDYVNKSINVFGHFYAADRSTYEQHRDTFLGILDSDVISTLQFEQAGSQRRYYGTYENIVFDYKDNGFCMFTIQYRCTNPFGEEIVDTTFFEDTATEEIYATVDSGGNIYALPRISATVVDIDDEETERNFSFTFTTGAVTRNIQINRIWAVGDIITIDSSKKRVYVNGQQVEYTGRWPQLLKTNTFRFNVTDAASFEVDLLIKYKKRYL